MVHECVHEANVNEYFLLYLSGVACWGLARVFRLETRTGMTPCVSRGYCATLRKCGLEGCTHTPVCVSYFFKVVDDRALLSVSLVLFCRSCFRAFYML